MSATEEDTANDTVEVAPYRPIESQEGELPGAASSAASAQNLVRPIPRPCPPGSTNYPPPRNSYNCQTVYQDNGNTGYAAGLRTGSAGGFGYLHALVDHNVDEETIAYVILNNAAGIRQPNGRDLYGLQFRVADVGLIAVEVIVQKAPPRSSMTASISAW